MRKSLYLLLLIDVLCISTLGVLYLYGNKNSDELNKFDDNNVIIGERGTVKRLLIDECTPEQWWNCESPARDEHNQFNELTDNNLNNDGVDVIANPLNYLYIYGTPILMIATMVLIIVNIVHCCNMFKKSKESKVYQ